MNKNNKKKDYRKEYYKKYYIEKKLAIIVETGALHLNQNKIN